MITALLYILAEATEVDLPFLLYVLPAVVDYNIAMYIYERIEK